MILLVDNFDSFTYNLVDYFEQIGEQCHIVRNDISPESLKALDFTSVVLSPGPGNPNQAGFLMEYIQYFEFKLPILGICLGHQALAQHYGATIEKAIKPMHGKLSSVYKTQVHPLFLNIPERWDVVRYHSLVVNNYKDTPIIPLAITTEQELMIFAHKQLPICGIQYHPEAVLTEFGIEILGNWSKIHSSKHKPIPALL